MIKTDIFSGFLGAGKTTLIKKLIGEAFSGEKVVLIENEFGEIGIDGGFLKEAGVEITEMNSGCICCSLVGDFEESLKKVVDEFSPDRILIEPSGVGKLSDIIKAVKSIENCGLELNSATAVADAKKCRMYMKNFGEFYNDQISHASCIVLSHTKGLSEDKITETIKLLREHNENATIVTTDWDDLTGEQILKALENGNSAQAEAEHMHEHHHKDCDCHEHHHDHHHKDCDCHEHHHDHHHEDCDCHEHHHDHHHEDCNCHEHHHDHHHEDCDCHEHHHGHHHHHADEVFTSIGRETVVKYSFEEIKSMLEKLSDTDMFGMVLRAKGIVESVDGKWINFDYVPGEPDVREGSADVTGKVCIIGSKINEHELEKLFRLN